MVKTRNLILATMPIPEPDDDGYLDLDSGTRLLGQRGYLEIRRCPPRVFANRLWHAIRAKALTNCLTEAQTKFIWRAVLNITTGQVEIPNSEPAPESLEFGDELLLVWETPNPFYPRVPALHQVVTPGMQIGGVSLFSAMCTKYLFTDASPIQVDVPPSAASGFWIGPGETGAATACMARSASRHLK